MATQEYKIKVEYGVSAIVLLIGAFFIFQAFTIETSREAVGPRTMPLYLAFALVLGGLWLAIRAFTGRAGDLKEGYGFLESDVKRIVMVILPLQVINNIGARRKPPASPPSCPAAATPRQKRSV